MSEVHVRGQIKWLTVTMVCEICCNCGMPFYMPQEYQQRKKDNAGETFYCPAGHGQHFLGKSKDAQIEELKRNLESESQMRQAASQRAHQAWITKQQVAGKMRKLKERVGAGVCPCCQRTFKQLADHMKCKHPEYGQ